MSLQRAIALKLGYDLRRLEKSDSLDQHLRRFFAHHEIDVVLDVGGFVGKFAPRLRQIGYRGRIISFEPSDKQFCRLSEAAGEDPNWDTLQLALGETNETRPLYISPGEGDLNSLYKPHESMLNRFEGLACDDEEQIEARRLDGILTREGIAPGARIFVKSDTQDLSVLRGLGDALQNVHGVLLEMSVQPLYHDIPSHWDVLDFLRANDFEPYGFSSLSRDAVGGLIEYDAVFRRAHAPA